MLLSLFFDNITIFLFLSLFFRIVFKKALRTVILRRNAGLTLPLAIQTSGIQLPLAIPPLAPGKKNNAYQPSQVL